MKYVVDKQIVLAETPEGPIATHISAFAKFVGEQGYSQYSIHMRVLIAAGFSRWLKKRGIRLRSITSEHLSQYLCYRARLVQPRQGDTAALSQLLKYLRDIGAIQTDKKPVLRLTPAERCTQAYTKYLREDRALNEKTIIKYIPFIRDFLRAKFGNGPVKLSLLNARDVVGFVQRRAPRLHLTCAKSMSSALRSFLKYIRYLGEIELDLAAAVPTVANWSMPSIPRAISPDQVRLFLASIDRQTAIGCRDYAILLLLARLGLRSSEVAFLELDDIDWTTGIMRVRSKGGLHNEFPLPPDVGNAIATYLQYGRPKISCRRVFLRANAPIQGFRGSNSVSCIVRHNLERAGIDAPTFGAHQFRHGLATEMLRQGASLGEIGDVLGHRHPKTTMIYTKVGLEALRTLALPWPGGVR